MLAEIITIGDEILIGQIVDTNSAWIGQQLSRIGVAVKQISSISDDRQHILKALAEASSRADLILITGGLGPTKDDVTKSALAEFFNVSLVTDQAALANVTAIFARSRRPMLEVNLKQAEILQNSRALVNPNGTAPGMWIEDNGRIYISMAGVPSEMKYIIGEYVLPELPERFHLPVIIHRTLVTAGLGESFLADRISDIEESLPSFIKLAYLPKPGLVRLRLSGTGEDRDLVDSEVSRIAGLISNRLGEFVMADQDITLDRAVLNILKEQKKKLCLAESCTGGYLAHLLTSNEGSSEVFEGGAVTYSNDLKVSVLGVRQETLRDYGAVSEQTVREMAEGALNAFRTNYALAVSGIAGPGGGTAEKPIGTVWVAAACEGRTIAKHYLFGDNRALNIERSATAALTLLIQLLRD